MHTMRMNWQLGHKILLTLSNYWLPIMLKNDTHINIRIYININYISIPIMHMIYSSLKADFLSFGKESIPLHHLVPFNVIILCQWE